ncbi:MAG: hypothetical protein NTY19_19915 [Planctomycetota bacterium]|nr:hypothetical protein [Planctomycetota bacterium]
MEGLLLLLAEFLSLPLLVAATAMLDLAVLGVDLVSGLAALAIRGTRRRDRSARQLSPAPEGRRNPWRATARWIGIGGASLLVVLLIALTVANWLFFDDLVRWQLARAGRKTGITVVFDSASGSLWTGVMELHEVKVNRTTNEASHFDLSVRKLSVDLAMLDLLFLKPVFEQVEVQGLRGTYDRVGLPEKLPAHRPFRLGRLEVRDAVIRVSDHTRPRNVQAQLQVDSLVAEPLRSDWAVFDLLFRCNAAGRIDGRDFSISTREIPTGRETRWRGDGLPVQLLAAHVGGPLEWIKSGDLDVTVTDRWQLGEQTRIDMHWKLVLQDIQAEVPGDASRTTRAVAKPAVAFLNKHALRLPLEFEVAIDRERFRFAASPQAAGLGRTVGDALAAELGRLAGIKPEAIKQAAAEGWTQFKDFLDKRRTQNRP